MKIAVILILLIVASAFSLPVAYASTPSTVVRLKITTYSDPGLTIQTSRVPISGTLYLVVSLRDSAGNPVVWSGPIPLQITLSVRAGVLSATNIWITQGNSNTSISFGLVLYLAPSSPGARNIEASAVLSGATKTTTERVLVLPASVSAAEPGCGATITKSTTLHSNIGPCPGDGLVIGQDGITLNCAGHTISGEGSNVGVALSGRATVTVKNCHVTGFLYGVQLSDSSGNELIGNSANGNGGDGYILDTNSAMNTLTRNTADSNSHFGFVLSDSSGNSLTRNTADVNGFAGFTVNGSSRDTLTKNSAEGNSEGFMLFVDSSVTLASNRADKNQFDGFSVVASSDNVLARNIADGNGGPGFSLNFGSNDNRLWSNTGDGNNISGFDVDSSSSTNSLASNTANNNSLYGYRDFTSGLGTAGTANTYSLDECSLNLVGGSSPTGLCSPKP
jgi:parallel beta-helix repeat protein